MGADGFGSLSRGGEPRDGGFGVEGREGGAAFEAGTEEAQVTVAVERDRGVAMWAMFAEAGARRWQVAKGLRSGAGAA